MRLRTREHSLGGPPPGGDAQAPGETAAPSRLRTDVQAALTVIGRRERSDSREERAGARLPLDLGGTDLRRAALAKAHLEGAILAEAHLETFKIVEKVGLFGANKLTAAQVRSAAFWESAHWSSEARAALGLALEDRAPTASPATQVDGSGDGTA